MRRGVGVSGLHAQQQHKAAYEQAGAALNAELTASMKVQMEQFQHNLESFAVKHKKDIQNNAVFRAKFHAMCLTVGVDPLVSSKGVWASTLGVGDYYYELAVRTAEICITTRVLNGGILDVEECRQRLKRKRFTFTEDISHDDVLRAVEKLKVLQGGFRLVQLDKKTVIQSMPVELSRDQVTAMQLCEDNGILLKSKLASKTGWKKERVDAAVKFLLDYEMCWLDLQYAGGEPAYWILGLVKGAAAQDVT
ncbi:Vacuolar-sorting protein SNF8 [Porphyridium purpureum]|uniref:Vacuolar-sorting protein SNF8 n=1 Tax=Porphyridium purpureum TaxID=35688 RepID=A0A5J4Z4U0_PORPP|nr:Vacuolar-sorting protein SNF8 [Porphyridium purpureum]|eukprot:POR4202..scf295_1